MTTGLWLWRKWCHVTSEAESQSYMDLFIGCSFSEFSHPSVRISSLSILLFSSICTDNWGRLSYLSLLFFGTLHSNGYIFSFPLCFSLPLFSQLFVRPPQTVILLFCISFSWGWSWFLPPVQCHEPLSIVHQALLSIRSSPLNLFLTFTV